MKILMSLLAYLGVLMSPLYSEEKEIEEYIAKALDFWKVPGASIAIVKDDKIVLAKGFGYTKFDKMGQQVNADTLFPIASLTKSFTAVACGVLVKEELLSWDSAIQSLWPSFKLSDTYAAKNLSLRDCLSMLAGLMDTKAECFWSQRKKYSEAALLEDLAKLSFPCGFRGCFAYENLLYNVIGYCIEKKTGISWGMYVKKRLLDRLKMQATTVDQAAFLSVTNKAFPHQWTGNTRKEVPFEDLDAIAPAAGLSSSASDMAKWLQFLLDKECSYYSIVKDTMSSQVIASPESFFPKGEEWLQKVFFPHSQFLNYGMGWFIHDYKGVKVCQDPGLTDGMNALMAVVPELNLGIVILNNIEAPFFSHSVLFHLIDYYRGENNDWNQPLLEIRKAHI